MNNRILLCVDGTDDALAVVRYAAGILSATPCEITLLHVMNKVPEALLDMGNNPEWLRKAEKVKAFEEKQRGHIKQFMDKSTELFLAAGLPAGRLTVQIRSREKGIARDIVAEAQKKYDVLIIGRGREGTPLPLGGVAGKIISASLRPALWLVGAVPSGHGDILVGLDGSENALKAVRHVGRMTCDTACGITLCNAARRLTLPFDGLEEVFGEQTPGDMAREFASAEKLARLWLNKSGVKEERVKTTRVSNVTSRAMALLREADKNNCGTIVVGKKGISNVPDFPMGRVTNKLAQIARSHALWIVNQS